MSPTVTVVIPTWNEQRRLGATLASVAAQTYPHVVEVLVADGQSTDRTREVVAEYPGVRVLDNPARRQAPGLNVALEAAKGDVIVRVDAHCELDDHYIQRCVEALDGTGAAMVGGALVPVGHTTVQRGIAAAMRSRVGVGTARFHSEGAEGWVDTVYLGAFRRADALAVGGYDEQFDTNEDAEFAHRLATRGGVWLDAGIHSTYQPRESLSSLAWQYWRYGKGRAKTVRAHPGSLRSRQVAAPLLLAALCSPWRKPVAALYGTMVLGLAMVEARQDQDAAPTFAAAIPIMHLAWGAGFLWGLAAESQPSRGSCR